jgi:hypothetical protein
VEYTGSAGNVQVILFHLIVQKEEQNTAYGASRASVVTTCFGRYFLFTAHQVYHATSFVHMTAYMVVGSSSTYKNVVAFAINHSVGKDVISKKNIQFQHSLASLQHRDLISVIQSLAP